MMNFPPRLPESRTQKLLTSNIFSYSCHPFVTRIYRANREPEYWLPETTIVGKKYQKQKEYEEREKKKEEIKRRGLKYIDYDGPVNGIRMINSYKDFLPTRREAATMSTIGGSISLLKHPSAKILGASLSIPTIVYDANDVMTDPNNPLNWFHLALDVQSGVSKGSWDEWLTRFGIINDATVAMTGYPPEHLLQSRGVTNTGLDDNNHKLHPYNKKLPDGEYGIISSVKQKNTRQNYLNGGITNHEMWKRFMTKYFTYKKSL